MTLYLLRHSLALSVGEGGAGSDEERKLSKEGRKLAAGAAKGMKRLGLDVDRILTSPLVRAVETARIVADELGCAKRVETCEALRSGMQAKRFMKFLDREVKDECLMAVGHQPDLGRLISYLLWGLKDTNFSLSECALAALEIEDEKAKLRLLLPAQTLSCIGKRS